MKICLDAGHYGNYNAGSVKGYYESKAMWTLTNYQKKFLEQYENVQVILTRSNQAIDMPVYDRGYKAKGCNLFISNHSNASSTSSTDYPVVIRSYDNKGNSDVLGKRLAEVVAKLMNTKQAGRTWTRTGKNGEYYGVLRGARAAGLSRYYIIEHSFHTNATACTWLLSDKNLEALAKAEVEAIANYYGLKKKTNSPVVSTPSQSTNYIVRITADTLRVRKDAGTQYAITDRVRKGDAYTIVSEKKDSQGDLWGKLKSGVGWICLKYTKRI